MRRAIRPITPGVQWRHVAHPLGLLLGSLCLLVLAAASARAQAPAPAADADDATATAEVRTPTPEAPREVAAAAPLGTLLSNSEFVYGRTTYGFDTAATVERYGGFLARHVELVDGQALTGPQIVERVAHRYSLGPRMLLALIELHSGWLRDPTPSEQTYPVDAPLPGLWAGLSSVADRLNRHYYDHRYDRRRAISVADGVRIAVPDTNAATFALLAYLTHDVPAERWPALERPSRFAVTWNSLYRDRLFYAGQATVPDDTPLPGVEAWLPFPAGEVWFYVTGPHSPAGQGAPRAAIDLAPPPAEADGCYGAVSFVTAAAAGRVVRSDAAEVIVDLDGDGFEGSGWVHVYRHLNDVDRVTAGTEVAAGDRLGHPSCDGGPATQTRVSFARRFNGEWVPVDRPGAELVLSGWTAVLGDAPGEGWLVHAALDPRPAASDKQPAVNGVTALPDG